MTTVAELTNLIAANLASNANTKAITPAKIREVMSELIPMLDEIIAARDGRATLLARIKQLAGPHNPLPNRVASYYDNNIIGNVMGTLSGVAGVIHLGPIRFNTTIQADRFGVIISTAVTSNGRVLIYNTDANGLPTTKLYESADLSFGTTGIKEVTLSFTFEAGKTYWVGVWSQSTATYRTVSPAGALHCGLLNGSDASANLCASIRRTVTWGGVAPDPWTFNAAELSINAPPAMRIRCLT